MKTAYDILGVARDASDSQIKTAFREKSKLLHPDRNKGKHADKEYDELKKAYDILKNPRTREEYDEALVMTALKKKGAHIPDEPIDEALGDWFGQRQKHHTQTRYTPPKQDGRCADEEIPDGFLW